MNEIKGKTYRENNINKKSYYKPIQNKNLSYNDDFVDKFIQNENFELNNIVFPINKKTQATICKEIQKINIPIDSLP